MILPRCPRCNAKVMQKSQDGKLRVRTSCLVFDDSDVSAVCKKCGTEVPLDLSLGQSLRKAITPNPRLIVRKVATPK